MKINLWKITLEGINHDSNKKIICKGALTEDLIKAAKIPSLDLALFEFSEIWKDAQAIKNLEGKK